MDNILEYIMPFIPLVGYGILLVFTVFLLYRYTKSYRLQRQQEPPQPDLEDPPYFVLE